MRLREWYGWHFPELSKIISDNLTYARTVLKVGIKTKTSETDLSDILTEEIEKDVKDAAEISMGTEINEIDEKYIQNLAT
jgi:nucleolar protein 58